ncbi:MAG: DNA cytosine methyltransferase, partial [Christensenellales bacterium]
MENVPQVIGQGNIQHFAKWQEKLESLGYKNKWQVLNAKDFGVPQNRERCFMVSILGDYYYEMPKPIKLEKRLKDLLEYNVDEKYYLSNKLLSKFCNEKMFIEKGTGKHQTNQVFDSQKLARTLCACDYKQPMLVKEDIKLYELTSTQSQGNRVYDPNGLAVSLCASSGGLGICINDLTTKNKRLATMLDKIDMEKTQALDIYNQSVHDEMHTIKTSIDSANMTAVTQNLRIRKLTPKECFRLMGVKDKDFEKVAKNQSNASLY